MTDFLLELLSEEIPARMQERARADLARLFADEIAGAGLKADAIETWSTPRRLALIARGLPEHTEAVRDELKGPRASAPPQALEGFLRKTGLTREQLEERDGVLFAVIEKPGRAVRDLLAEAVPTIVRAFPWPKSMRWGEASSSTESLRWVRPLQGVVALFGEEIVEFEIAGIRSGAATVGHRFHHPGAITIGSANDYAEKLRACHVILDHDERRRLIAEGAHAAAEAAGLSLVEDEGLLVENAGLTEWPVPLLGEFDPAFLDVPPEVIQLTMRTNQKYFALNPLPSGERVGERSETGRGAEPTDSPSPSSLRDVSLSPEGRGLAPNFICTANIDAHDGGAGVVAGNRKVLAARLSDAKFFWEQDLKVPLEEQAKELDQIVFHEKLGTVADKVERVAKLARWLVEEGIVTADCPPAKAGVQESLEMGLDQRRVGSSPGRSLDARGASNPTLLRGGTKSLADMAEQAARLCKADLVTGMVGEFPELQGVMGGYYARAQGLDPQVAEAIRDHYKPVGQGDEVPTASVTVAVSLADKLDTLFAFFAIGETPSGSRDPFALRRAALGVIRLLIENNVKLPLVSSMIFGIANVGEAMGKLQSSKEAAAVQSLFKTGLVANPHFAHVRPREAAEELDWQGNEFLRALSENVLAAPQKLADFMTDRLKVQQREAGVRHDLIDAVFALGGEDDLVRLLARVKALQAFVGTEDGANLLVGYRRAANILKKEGYSPSPLAGEGQLGAAKQGEGVGAPASTDAPSPRSPSASRPSPARGEGLGYESLPQESALIAALDGAEPRAASAIEREDFAGAMSALASLRVPIDAFFDKVTVNDPDAAKRDARLALLARIRDAVHRVADFSRIEG